MRRDLTLDEYIEVLNDIAPVTPELEKEIREVRNSEKMTVGQLKALCEIGVTLRVAYTRNPNRNLFCKEDGTIVIWDTNRRYFRTVAYFSDAATPELQVKRARYSEKRARKRKLDKITKAKKKNGEINGSI